jgi:hypothetical protein
MLAWLVLGVHKDPLARRWGLSGLFAWNDDDGNTGSYWSHLYILSPVYPTAPRFLVAPRTWERHMRKVTTVVRLGRSAVVLALSPTSLRYGEGLLQCRSRSRCCDGRRRGMRFASTHCMLWYMAAMLASRERQAWVGRARRWPCRRPGPTRVLDAAGTSIALPSLGACLAGCDGDRRSWQPGRQWQGPNAGLPHRRPPVRFSSVLPQRACTSCFEAPP